MSASIEVLVCLRLLERRQLAAEHLGLEEVSLAGLEPLPDHRRRPVEEDKPSRTELPAQEVAVGAPER